MSRIAIIGFGVMGRAAGEKVNAAGHTVIVFDPSAASAKAAAALRLAVASSAAEAAASAEIVLLFLPGPDQIRAAVAGPEGLLSRSPAGQVIVDHSTADPDTARDMAVEAEARGVGWVDAPVLGRPSATGNWALPCGATPGALDAVKPVFETYARSVFDMGGPGNGHTVKLLNQMMFGAINAMTAEMMATSEKLGLPPGRLYEIMTSSQAGTVSNLFKELGRRINEDDYDDPTFSVKLLEKDIRLGLEMAKRADIDTRLGDVVAQMNRTAIAKGFGDQDSSVMWRSVADA